MNEKILCVDDDINILRAFRRLMQKEYMFEIANSGQAALTLIAEQGPFAVVVSDLKMPEMDGVQFLTTVREKSPDSIRVMLTGQADLETAIAAVNEGNIFRFLTKPCSPEILGKTLQAALEQYRLVTAERTLLRQTLVGSVQVVTNTLNLVNPTAFGQGSRLKPSGDSNWPLSLADWLHDATVISLAKGKHGTVIIPGRARTVRDSSASRQRSTR